MSHEASMYGIQEAAPAEDASSRLWLFLLLLLLVLLAARVCQLLLPALIHPAQPAGEPVLTDHSYFVTVTELALRDPPAAPASDQKSKAAPKVSFKLVWRNAEVYASQVKPAAAAVWQPADIDLRALVFNQRRVTVDELVQAPRVTVGRDDVLRVQVLGASGELIGEVPVAARDLRVGDQTYAFPGAAVQRVVMRVAEGSRPDDMLRP